MTSFILYDFQSLFSSLKYSDTLYTKVEIAYYNVKLLLKSWGGLCKYKQQSGTFLGVKSAYYAAE